MEPLTGVTWQSFSSHTFRFLFSSFSASVVWVLIAHAYLTGAHVDVFPGYVGELVCPRTVLDQYVEWPYILIGPGKS